MARNAKLLGRRLLAWFDRQGRALPWREGRGARSGRGESFGARVTPVGVPSHDDSPARPDVYRVWLSEIMLQQTTVATVAPYYARFLARWPTVAALAAAPLDDVLHAWQGLGYYARARNLHRAAREVAGPLGGKFPRDEAGLARLPGVGPYTAAAVAAIAYGERTVPVDGNVARVIARLHGLRVRLPEGRAAIAARALAMLPLKRSGDFAEALMDLGATVCTARNPRCGECPWDDACRAHASGNPESFPPKKKKPARPTRHAVVFWAGDGRGRVLVRRRPEKGLLGGMMEFPSTPWRATPWSAVEATRHAPAKGNWQSVNSGAFAHAFSHFTLKGKIVRARVAGGDVEGLTWWPIAELDRLALPSVMKKVVKAAGATGRIPQANRKARKASSGR
jgi:A/G-specific adenine glycosylase